MPRARERPRADAVMLHPRPVAHLIEQLGGWGEAVYFRTIIGCVYCSVSSRNNGLQSMYKIIHLGGVFSPRISGVYF